MRLDEAHERYIRWLLASRDLSPHTIRAYESDLSSFERHAGAQLKIEQIDRDDLLAFLEKQRDAGLSHASLRRRASALRGLGRWMHTESLLKTDPWDQATIALRRPRRLPRALPGHELNLLLGFLMRAAGVDGERTVQPAQILERPHESTTLLAVSLMVATGVRVHEVVGFRCRDIDFPSRSIRLIGKGRRERQVFLPNDWITSLTETYAEARAELTLRHPHLLFNLHLDPLTPAATRSRLTKAAASAGLSQRVTPHMLRHTAATQLIEAGVDIRYIQRLLGHASLSTTEIYTHVSDDALKRVVSEADVLGRLTQTR